MSKNLVKHAACFLMVLALATPVMALAQDFGEDYIEDIHVPKTNDSDALPNVVINIINIVLGFLALIAIVIIIIAGFEWMTAGGNEDKVKKSQKRMIAGLIGLAIIFLSYAIVRFVLAKLSMIAD